MHDDRTCAVTFDEVLPTASHPPMKESLEKAIGQHNKRPERQHDDEITFSSSVPASTASCKPLGKAVEHMRPPRAPDFPSGQSYSFSTILITLGSLNLICGRSR